MLCPYSNIDQNPDFTMAEFTIFPSFRRKHYALDATKMILDSLKMETSCSISCYRRRR